MIKSLLNVELLENKIKYLRFLLKSKYKVFTIETNIMILVMNQKNISCFIS